VLALVFPDGHQIGVVEQHVGGLQHRVGEQPHGRGVAPLFLRLVLELRHPRCLPEAGETAQHPSEFGVRGHVALHEDRAAHRIDAKRQVLRGGDQRATAQLLGILRDGDGVQVDDAEVRVVFVLEGHPLLDRTQRVAQMQGIRRGLYAGEDDATRGIQWRRS